MSKRISLVSVFLATIAVSSLLFVSPSFAEVVLKIGTLSNDANQLDPHVSTKSQDKILFPWVFNGLVRFAPGSADLSQIEADLAESWKSSADGLIWTFKLRKGVKFHSGCGKLTAEGKSNKDVAELLHISLRTVHHHRAALMQKLKIRNTAGIVRYAIEKNYI